MSFVGPEALYLAEILTKGTWSDEKRLNIRTKGETVDTCFNHKYLIYKAESMTDWTTDATITYSLERIQAFEHRRQILGGDVEVFAHPSPDHRSRNVSITAFPTNLLQHAEDYSFLMRQSVANVRNVIAVHFNAVYASYRIRRRWVRPRPFCRRGALAS